MELDAQATTIMAIVPAPRSTSAYSAVDCPRSERDLIDLGRKLRAGASKLCFGVDDGDGREYKWNEDIGFFESEADDAGKKWVKGIDSSVPGYWFTCPQIVGSNSKGYDIVCATPHFVFIYQDGEKLTCRKCNKESTIKLVLPEE